MAHVANDKHITYTHTHTHTHTFNGTHAYDRLARSAWTATSYYRVANAFGSSRSSRWPLTSHSPPLTPLTPLDFKLCSWDMLGVRARREREREREREVY